MFLMSDHLRDPRVALRTPSSEPRVTASSGGDSVPVSSRAAWFYRDFGGLGAAEAEPVVVPERKPFRAGFRAVLVRLYRRISV